MSGQSAGGVAENGGSTAGGRSGASGGNGDAGKGGAGSSAAAGMSGTSGVSPAEACITYAVAFCQRSLECAGDPISEAEAYACASNCPDVMFAPGSTRTVDGLLSCAQEVTALSCEDHNAAHYPPCVSAGTKPLGEPCVYNSQCASLLCKVAGACGVCVRPVGVGEDCSGDDVGCSADLSCRNGVCEAQGNPDVHDFGEPCADITECDQLNGHCNEQTGLCERYPGEGESCEALNACQAAFYCKGPEKICTLLPELDEPCGNDVRSLLPACKSGLACTVWEVSDDVSGTCVEPYEVEAGDSCFPRAARCVESSCRCDDSTCSDAHCVAPLLLGDACAAAGTEKCVSPLTCTGGVCTAPEYGNDYETTCMP